MSELFSVRYNRNDSYRQLLGTVSALTLLATASVAFGAELGSETDRPVVWIELGGQLERQTGQGDVVVQPFIAADPTSPAFQPVSPLHTDKAPLFSNGGDAKITFQPDGSDWSFLASIRYGRSSGDNALQQRAPGRRVKKIAHVYDSGFHRVTSYVTPIDVDFSETKAKQNQTHAVLDFQAGRDVGLGLFGMGATSTVNFGVRYAQFGSRANFNIHAFPDVKTFNGFGTYLANLGYYFPAQSHHSFAAAGTSARNFHGIGPSLSWNETARLLGDREAYTLEINWGLNAAVLFGRQKASGNHQTSGRDFPYPGGSVGDHYAPTYVRTGSFDRKHSVIVPNVGAFAGVSFRYSNAKVSFGYRGDFFFGAMDAGNDQRRNETVGFYGPFATISVGLGG